MAIPIVQRPIRSARRAGCPPSLSEVAVPSPQSFPGSNAVHEICAVGNLSFAANQPRSLHEEGVDCSGEGEGCRGGNLACTLLSRLSDKALRARFYARSAWTICARAPVARDDRVLFPPASCIVTPLERTAEVPASSPSVSFARSAGRHRHRRSPPGRLARL